MEIKLSNMNGLKTNGTDKNPLISLMLKLTEELGDDEGAFDGASVSSGMSTLFTSWMIPLQTSMSRVTIFGLCSGLFPGPTWNFVPHLRQSVKLNSSLTMSTLSKHVKSSKGKMPRVTWNSKTSTITSSGNFAKTPLIFANASSLGAKTVKSFSTFSKIGESRRSKISVLRVLNPGCLHRYSTDRGYKNTKEETVSGFCPRLGEGRTIHDRLDHHE